MKEVIWLAIILGLIVNTTQYVAKTRSTKVEKKPISIDDYLKNKFSMKGFSAAWISDHELRLNTNGAVNVLDLKTQVESTLLSKELLDQWKRSTPIISPDRKWVLIRHDTESIYRHSMIYKCDVYNIEEKKVYELHNGKDLQLCVWSPTGDGVASVFNNDVYYWRVQDKKEHRLTFGGKEGIIYYGIPDWVYEEEVLQDNIALWFSPSSKKLAVAEFDDTDVQTYGFPYYKNLSNPSVMGQYPEHFLLKYPKPGTPNPIVALRVTNLEGLTNSQPTWTKFSPPPTLDNQDHILQSVTWINDEEILLIWLNRRQNKGTIQKCTFNTGKCAEILSLDEPKGWINIGNPKCYSKSNKCIFTYWIDNWFQIWNLDLATGKNTFDAFGDFTVTKVFGLKESTGEVFYLGTGEGHPERRNLYRNNECLSCKVVDADKVPCDYADASFSTDFTYYALICQGPTVPYTDIYETANQKVLVNWEHNKEKRKELENYQLPVIKFLNISVDDGYTASVKMMLPEEINFDNPNQNTRKYPMIVSVYGGPNSVRAVDSFSISWESYLITSRKVIYTIIDGRGSGNKGKNILFEINNRLGSVEVTDQIKVTKQLQDTYSFIDKERTGIWGWSYGGYVTAMVISKDNDRVFQCGISVAPVTAWIYYDSIYTERYNGLPTKEDNWKEYEAGDVTRNIENFKNHDYMLVHGTGDDNVHYQQALALAKSLQKAEVLFEQVSYPDEDHSLGNVRPHLYHTMDQFWVNCLNIDAEEEE